MVEQRAIHLQLPTAYDSSLYTMRLHIGLIRSHLESILANGTSNGKESDQSSARRLSAEFSPAPPDRQSAE